MRRKKRSDPVGPVRLMGKWSLALAKLQQAERQRSSAPTQPVAPEPTGKPNP